MLPPPLTTHCCDMGQSYKRCAFKKSDSNNFSIHTASVFNFPCGTIVCVSRQTFIWKYTVTYILLTKNRSFFFCLTPPPYSQFRDPGVRPAPRGAIRLRGKEVVFFEAEWPGFEPRTTSIRTALSTPLRPTWPK